MSSRVGSRLTLQQARTLGAIQSFQPHGTDSGDAVEENDSGDDATFSLTDNGVDFQMTGDVGEAWASIFATSQTFSSGQLIVYNAWETNTAIGGLDATSPRLQIGVLWRGFGDALTPEDQAVFRPHVGQDTDGNVEVLRATTSTTGQVTYPTINDGPIWTNLLIDRDKGQTEFYINKNPLTASPDEIITAVPEFVRSFGFLMGGDPPATADTAEILTGALSGYIYIP